MYYEKVSSGNNSLISYFNQFKIFSSIWNKKSIQNASPSSYKPPAAKNVDEYFEMGSIEIEIDGEADPEMVMAEVKEIVEERKRRLQL